MSDMPRLRIPTLRVPLGNVVGDGPEIHKIYQIVQRAARTTHPLLIVGEAGTGKEMIARTIHSSGPLRHMQFTSLDCASLPTEGLQVELSGAIGNSLPPGDIKGDTIAAYCGTIFLNRVGDLTLDAQGRLLRAIQDREIWTIHDSLQPGSHLRILAATTRDLKLAVEEGTFRRDLYFRLNVLSLRVPPLRERRHDIPLLVCSFLDRLSNALGRQYRMSEEALKALLMYDWPGNVRELEACMQHACSAAREPIIGLLDLPRSIRGTKEIRSISLANVGVVPLHEIEKRSILEAMLQARGNKRLAAQLLGIGKTTLYRKLKDFGAEDRESK